MSKKNFISEAALKDKPQNKYHLVIKDGAVSTDKLADSAVKTGKIADENVTTEKIKDRAITNDKVADKTLTADKFSEELNHDTIEVIKELQETKFDKENVVQELGDSEEKVVSQAALPFRYIQSEEFIFAQVDAEDHLLFGIQLDGTPVFGKKSSVEESLQSQVALLAERVATIIGDEDTTNVIDSMNELKQFFANIENTQKLTDILLKLDTVYNNLNTTMDNVDKTVIKDEEGNILQTPFKIIDSPEFLHVVVDAEDHFLFGIQLDGSVEWAKGIPAPIREKLSEIVNQVATDKADLSTKIDELNSTLQAALDTKVDKEEGKSLIDDEVKNCFELIENDEWLTAMVDAENHLLFGIHRDTGKPYFPLNDMYHVEQNEEFFALWLDKEDHILMGIRRDGQIIGEIHAVTTLKEVVSSLQSEIDNLKESVTTIDNNLQELLNVFSLQENPEFLAVETDAEGKMLAYTKNDGSHYVYNMKSETIPEEFSHIEDPEGRMSIVIDKEGKVWSYRDKDGSLNEDKVKCNELYCDGSKINFNDFEKKQDIEEKLQNYKPNSQDINIEDVNGVKNHNKENLYKVSLFENEDSITLGDKIYTIPAANFELGYRISNAIECKAGETFTRTGTATGIVIVSDETDTISQRIENPQNTFTIPINLTWVKRLRAVALNDGSVTLNKGNYAIPKEDRGSFLSIDNIKIGKKNLSKDVAFLQSPDGSYWSIYIDNNGNISAIKTDPEVIQATDLPSNFPSISMTGTFDGLFDRFVIMTENYIFDLKESGIVKLYNFGKTNYMFANCEHVYNSDGEGRYIIYIKGSYPSSTNEVYGVVMFDDNFNLVKTKNTPNGCLTINNVGTFNAVGDFHDFKYIDDNDILIFTMETINANDVPLKDNMSIHVNTIQEIKDGKVYSFSLRNYPKLYTDYANEYPEDPHMNTIELDYDGNLLINLRNCESWVKISRKVTQDGAIMFGTAPGNYDTDIIGRVGGRRNAFYIDSKRVLPSDFSFRDVPTGYNLSTDSIEPWQFNHCHDLKYWGMKNIDGKEYPTYTLFDNNYPLSNNIHYNADDKFSRVVQLSIDWGNHLIKEYKVYQIKGYYSQTRGGATMYEEGKISIAFANMGIWGVYDFTTDSTNISNNVYDGAKVLFEARYTDYSGDGKGLYRANTYKLK